MWGTLKETAKGSGGAAGSFLDEDHRGCGNAQCLSPSGQTPCSITVKSYRDTMDIASNDDSHPSRTTMTRLPSRDHLGRKKSQ